MAILFKWIQWRTLQVVLNKGFRKVHSYWIFFFKFLQLIIIIIIIIILIPLDDVKVKSTKAKNDIDKQSYRDP